MTTVLLVEDDTSLLRALRINLRARGYKVVIAGTGASALNTAARDLPDLVLLDLGLPDIDGLDVIRSLRAWTDVPIIVLTGRPEIADTVAALDLGADDYVTKPFSMEELLARIRVAERHRSAGPDSDVAVRRIGRYAVDLSARTVCCADGASVHLTPTEWRILEVMLAQPNVLVSSADLIRAIWGPRHHGDSSALRFHLTRLRRKLEPQPAAPVHLLTQAGMGYRYRP